MFFFKCLDQYTVCKYIFPHMNYTNPYALVNEQRALATLCIALTCINPLCKMIFFKRKMFWMEAFHETCFWNTF